MSQEQTVRIALLGMGTVGSGVFSVLSKNRAEIERRSGCSIEVVYACTRDPDKARHLDLQGLTLSDDALAAVNDASVDIVVELIGGCDAAKQFVEQAIRNGKHVVTANKALLALHGQELFALAQQHGVALAYEAAVAGGIPIVKALREGLAANVIERVLGIINGTSNYILTELDEKHKSFAEALREAQELGYAEADPSLDINGTDAAHKLTILASIAFGIPLQFDKVYVEGLESIEVQDVVYAKELGYCLKHLATAKRSAQGIELRVHPALIPRESLLASVRGSTNAVAVDANAVGPTLYCGAGAGSEQTASAVVADLLDVIRTMTASPQSRVPYLAYAMQSLQDIAVLDIDEVVSDYYLRLQLEDRPQSSASVAAVLSELDIGVEAMIQKEVEEGGVAALVFLTHPSEGQRIKQAITKIEKLDVVQGKPVSYRLEQL